MSRPETWEDHWRRRMDIIDGTLTFAAQVAHSVFYTFGVCYTLYYWTQY